jgi:hypothetical protein
MRRIRTFVANEDASGAARIVALSDGFCQRQFAGNGAVVGRQVALDGARATVSGILPPAIQLGRRGG